VPREASSREAISVGCWFGDDRFGVPAFSASTAPEPAGLAEQPLAPAAAWWAPRGGGHLAVLRYDDARAASDPGACVLGCYQRADLARRPAGRLGPRASGLPRRHHRPTPSPTPAPQTAGTASAIGPVTRAAEADDLRPAMPDAPRP
jgi:hypothetical protein